MATGAQQVFFTQKRILGLEDFDDRFMEYLKAKTEELFALTYSVGGVFASTINFAASGADQFDLDLGTPATDGDGHVLTLDAALGENIQYENSLGITYFVGLRFSNRPRGVQINPRTGQPEFQILEEVVGDSAAPDAVVNLGANLEFTVDSVTEPGVNNAGRKILVYKNNPGPNATSEAVAIETLTVVWDGANNKVTSAALFGQVGTPSVVLADYTVILLGPTVKRGTDLSLIASNAFIGTVLGTGAGTPPVVFDITSQNLIDTTLTGLDDITRVGTNLDLKVSVDAHPLDVGENQIEVLDAPSGSVVFSVDEAGNVRIEGNLVIVGTETVQNVETVQSNSVVANNLLAGDNDADAHTFQGDLTHVSTGFGGTTFAIDGATGVVTINSPLSVANLDIVTSLDLLIGSNLNVQSGADIEVLNGGNINLTGGGTVEVGAASAINVQSAAAINFASSSNAIFASGSLLVLQAGSEIFGNMVPNLTAFDVGTLADDWRDVFLSGRLFFGKTGVDSDAIVFDEAGTANFAIRTNFSGGADANDLALDTPNGQVWVINRLGEAVWGTGVTDADLDLDVQMRIRAQANHKALRVDMASDFGVWATFTEPTTGNTPVAANTGLSVDNESATVGAVAALRLDVEDEGGYMVAKRVANGITAMGMGQRVSGAFFQPSFFITGGVSAPKAGFGFANLFPTAWTPQAALHSRQTGQGGRTNQGFLDNALFMDITAAGHYNGLALRNPSYTNGLFIGLDGADPTVAERANLSMYVDDASADNRRWWSFDMAQGLAAIDRNDSAGMMMYMGRDFHTPSGSTEKQAEQLVGLNQNKSIVARGRILAGATLDGTANQHLNVASVAGGGGTYTITFDTPVTLPATIVAICDSVGTDDPTIQVVSQSSANVVFGIYDGASLEAEDFRFLIVGRPNNAPSL